MLRGLVVALALFAATASAAPSDAAKAEIEHLFAYLKASGCKFHRNGAWHSAEKAVDHLRTKYEYLLKKNLATTAESFVANGASKSSMSGKPYLVQCGAGSAVSSAQWFMAELANFRGRNGAAN